MDEFTGPTVGHRCRHPDGAVLWWDPDGTFESYPDFDRFIASTPTRSGYLAPSRDRAYHLSTVRPAAQRAADRGTASW